MASEKVIRRLIQIGNLKDMGTGSIFLALAREGEKKSSLSIEPPSAQVDLDKHFNRTSNRVPQSEQMIDSTIHDFKVGKQEEHIMWIANKNGTTTWESTTSPCESPIGTLERKIKLLEAEKELADEEDRP
ncbi:hypothetical protein AgCh_028359 [Apium graveolens]